MWLLLSCNEIENLQKQIVPKFSDRQREIIGQNIQSARIKTRYSQADIAEVFGISKRQISRYETGESPCSIEMMLSFCKLYGCRLNDILPEEYASCVSVFDAIYFSADKPLLEEMSRKISGCSKNKIA